MKYRQLKIVLISTPIGFVGSGKGGGVELTLISIIKGFLSMGHKVALVAPEGSVLPKDCSDVDFFTCMGKDQISWQHRNLYSPATIPFDGVLPKLLGKALELGKDADLILNLCYDWLPLWLTEYVDVKIFHLISMGGVSKLMEEAIKNLSKSNHLRLAFHTNTQASDYELTSSPIVLGNGCDLNNYNFQSGERGPLGWAGRVAPEKGLEDAVKVAELLGDQLLVWGLVEDKEYAAKIEHSVAPGTIKWRGFLDTKKFQNELGTCRVLINTPKWNEAYGNVVMESMACGVPVVAYNRGGPSEIIESGTTGWLVSPDDISELKDAVLKVDKINRKNCRKWASEYASYQAFAKRIYNWLIDGLDN